MPIPLCREMHPFLLMLPLLLIETPPPNAADTADEAEVAQAADAPGRQPAAGPNAAVGEVRHAAAATHANDILLPGDTDDTSGRLLLLDMVALLLFMPCMCVLEISKWWDRETAGARA